MVTLAQRIEELRTAKGLSRPALAAALGFPRTAIEKFETGRQTPTQDQQNKLASYFGVSLFYLRGGTNDTTQMSDWMDGAFLDEPAPAPAPKRAVKPVVEYLQSCGDDFKILVVPDHRTPLALRTHTADPVPFVIYDSRNPLAPDSRRQFSERAAAASGLHFDDGYEMTDFFFERKV